MEQPRSVVGTAHRRPRVLQPGIGDVRGTCVLSHDFLKLFFSLFIIFLPFSNFF
jgi:hypothetical protein